MKLSLMLTGPGIRSKSPCYQKGGNISINISRSFPHDFKFLDFIINFDINC
jgi:hypothetical protein